MKSLQDYIDIYSNIAKNLNYQGDSVELLVQLLANASYIGEVENIAYAQEASLEKSTLINSKIQHCMNEMYSVFRGTCPRVIIKFRPTKYFNFNTFDELISSNTFKVYYLGYYNSTGEVSYAPISLPPAIKEDDVYTIVGLLAKDTVVKDWVLDSSNTYYVNCLEEDLSNDLRVFIEGTEVSVGRNFSDHVQKDSVFDLTLPSFGSRLYLPSSMRTSTKVSALYFKLSRLDGYNKSDLTRLSLKGGELVKMDTEWLASNNLVETNTGICYVPETECDDLQTIHYKAAKDRFVNSTLRSNSDIGTILEEYFPEKVVTGGSSFDFEVSSNSSTVNIYYVPQSKANLITDKEIRGFISDRAAYYVTDNIEVIRGMQFTVIFSIDVEIYQGTSIDDEVGAIIKSYGNTFGTVFTSETIEEIKSLISKISNVKRILSITTTYTTEDGTVLSLPEIAEIDPNKSYYQVKYVLNSIL